MKRCDVCHEPIPFGVSICPNCGNKIKKSDQVQNDASKRSGWGFVVFFVFVLVIGGIVLTIFSRKSPTIAPESTYVALEDYEQLMGDYEEVAKIVKPYRDYAVKFLNEYNSQGEDALSETYTVINGELMSATLSGSIANDAYSEHTMISIKKDLNSEDWIFEIYDYYLWDKAGLFYDSFGEWPIHYISKIMNLNVEMLSTKYIELTVRNNLYTGKEIQVECENGFFTMRFEGDRMTYQYVENLKL